MTQKDHYDKILSRLDIEIPAVKKVGQPIALVLSYFKVHLAEQQLSASTLRKHDGNIQLIAHFNAHYDVADQFELKDFSNGPYHEYRFIRMVSDSEYALKSYLSTWNKLNKYIKQNFSFLQSEIDRM